ncbi:MAG: hypothetical protein LRY55_08105 [Leadbetterella sp.]|nr:hypothetical protein [Leadbetterella sp.]
MGFTEKQQEDAFEEIFNRIINGESLRSILIGGKRTKVRLPRWTTFFEWLESSDQRMNQYAYAIELRNEFYADKMLEVAFGIGTAETIT